MTPSQQSSRGKDLGIDLSQFTGVFFEEANEHLENMESLLLAISDDSPSDEDLNAIFRAAHSIKGGAAMFGMSDVAELTHELESLLDALRKHEFRISGEMIEAFLQGRDITGRQLGRHRSGAGALPIDEESEALKARLRHLKSTGGGSSAQGTRAPTARLAVTGPIDTPGLAPRSVEPDDIEVAYARLREDLAGVPGAHATTEDLRRVVESIVGQQANPSGAKAAGARKPQAEEDGFGFFDPPPPAAKIEPLASETRPAGADRKLARSAVADTTPPVPTTVVTSVPASGAKGEGTSAKTPAVANESNSIRVAIEKVDQLINMVGELVITQAMLTQRAEELDPLLFRNFLSAMSDLERNTRSLQEAVMSIRMLPMAMVFNRFPRMVRDLAAKLGKKIELKMVGEATELDKGLIEKIVDPLTHLVRNSLDHGIETPEKRMSAGKSPHGTITLSAYQQGGAIIIEVADDGAGLDRERILSKARERGMNAPDSMTDNDVWMLIFEAGFSTAAVITDVSGRGVGMDVVKRNIGALNGTVEIHSEGGRGTRMTVRLPLTLAIMDGMSIGIGGQTYIVPLSSIVESLQVSDATVKSIRNAARVIQVRSEYIPVASLRDLFGTVEGYRANHDPMLVIVENEGAKLALMVDELLGQHQVVVKSLEANYRRVSGVSAATIMGDGRVAFILDVPGLIRMTRH